ncbi:RICIN domain-containing protein [Aquabacterium sp. A7-Y]|uniref:RICIN domain-containing protein n=1 Tax=Aquabacterium sp. A7-Y TaxID=1349605 RepID=UPI00223DC5A6|nr:RICIN domain-containing protein [Aquabacterium sp. A7-Y]MCW7541288.1 RICIN domain-containing protein [Aquabacterium sp. A7-Y]
MRHVDNSQRLRGSWARGLTMASAVCAFAMGAGTPGDASAQQYHWLVNRNSGLCLTASAGSGERPVYQGACNEDARFELYYPVDYSRLMFRHKTTDLCLVTRGSGESAAVLSTCNPGWADQLWYWYFADNPGGQDMYQYQNANSRLCLAARGGGRSRAVQTTCGDWVDQQWRSVATY